MALETCEVIEMVLKSLFLPQNHKNLPAAGVSALCNTLELRHFFQHGA